MLNEPSQKDQRMDNPEHLQEGKNKVLWGNTKEVSCAGNLEEVAS